MPKVVQRVPDSKMPKETPIKSDIKSVTTTLENLFVKNPAYTSSGVPMKVLQTQVALQLLKNEEKGDDTELWAKASELINRAVDEEIAMKNSSGNINLGPNVFRKTDCPSSENKEKKSSPPPSRGGGALSPSSQLFIDMEEDDDAAEDEEEVKPSKKQDKPYRPTGVKVTPPPVDGAASSRPRRRVPMHKGRYDSSEYVFPEYLRAYKKRNADSGNKKPEKPEKPEKPPKQATKRKSAAGSSTGPQPKKPVQKSGSTSTTVTTSLSTPTTSTSTCSSPSATTTTSSSVTSSVATQSATVKLDTQTSSSPSKMTSPTLSLCVICKYWGPKNLSSLSMMGCVSCTAKAHKSCVDPKSKDRFICNSCVTAKEPRCCLCLDNKNQNQVQCSSCGCHYHRNCHTPTLESKVKASWSCFKCQILKRTPDPKIVAKTANKQLNSIPGNSGKFKNSVVRRNSSVDSGREETSETAVSDDKSSVKTLPGKVTEPEPVIPAKLSSEHTVKESLSPVQGTQKVSTSEGSVEFSESAAQTPVLDCNNSGKEKGGKLRLPPSPPLLDHPDFSIPDVTEWTSLDVYNYFLDKFTEDIAFTFIEQDIDGCALKLIKKPDVVNMFKVKKFKLNVGVQVLLHIKKLQLRTKDLRIIWEDIDSVKSD